jgi:hypothetical protein
VAELQILDSSRWLPPDLPAGIYCSSFYWKSNFPGRIWLGIFPVVVPQSLGTNAIRKYEASVSWQRIWVAFYYPGNNTRFVLSVVSYVAPIQKISPWQESGIFHIRGWHASHRRRQCVRSD